MLQSGLSVLAALAFVLALGAVCIWLLKRFGAGRLMQGSRVPVEVVQRIALGPKVGLAVVRVGERVMAISIGDGGVRTLFELNETDRQHVLSTSTLPASALSASALSNSALSNSALSPSASPTSAGHEAQTAPPTRRPNPFATFFTQLFAERTHRVMAMDSDMLIADLASAPSVNDDAAMSFAHAYASSVVAQEGNTATEFVPTVSVPMSNAYAPPTRRVSPFIDSLATPNVVTSAGQPVTYSRTSAPSSSPDRAFREMLGVSLSGATRLLLFIGVLIVSNGAMASAHAQVAPPVPPRVVPTTPNGATDSLAQPRAAAPVALPTAQSVTAPSAQTPVAPLLPANARGVRSARPASTAAPARATAPNKNSAGKGNGASLDAAGAASTRPMVQMVFDSANTNGTKNDSTRKRAAPAPTANLAPVAADDALRRLMPQMDMRIGDEQEGGLRLNGTVGIIVMMGLLTLLPTLLLMMTGFTRILIVLHFLKQAMGTQGAPPAQLLAGLALLLTGFVMAPVLTEVNRDAITPWLDGQITQVDMLKNGVKPMREFMLHQTKPDDIKAFVELSHLPRPNTVDDVPLHVLMCAFVTSELRTSFYIGFMIYLPFIIIDTVVASVLMSMGMMMLPPAMVSLPFKLLLFVLVDGWTLLISELVKSFRV